MSEVKVETSADPEMNSEELEELRDELKVLGEERDYHEFLDTVVMGKPLPVDDDKDADYDPEKDDLGFHDCSHEDDGGTGDPEKAEGPRDQPDSDSSEDDIDDDEEEEATDDTLRLPPEVLDEARKRFPPFWRTHLAFR